VLVSCRKSLSEKPKSPSTIKWMPSGSPELCPGSALLAGTGAAAADAGAAGAAAAGAAATAAAGMGVARAGVAADTVSGGLASRVMDSCFQLFDVREQLLDQEMIRFG
jgi:hypothetical protein